MAELTLDAGRGVKTDARPHVLGHNMTAIDWHGTAHPSTGAGNAPVVWSLKEHRADPAVEALASAFPLRVLRYHSGNNYQWRKGIGPQEERQSLKASEGWSLPYRGYPGLDEFLRWAQSLPQKPEISLIASPFLPVKDLEDMVAYCNATSGPMAELRAANGHPEPYGVKYWELGNETDWEKRADLDILRAESAEEIADKLTPEQYVELCRVRIEALRKIDPSIQFYAHAQTAPWPASNPQWRAWHREVLRGIGEEIDGVVIHPYYDGYNIPYVMASVDALIADINALQPVNRFGRPVTVVVNEHAKWVDPSKRENWPASWGLQGAVSTGDFLLQLMSRPEVSTANYWCFIHQGPWRVIDTDLNNADPAKRYTPTAIHHLYQLLNDAMLPEFRLLTPVEGEKAQTAALADYPYAVTAGLFSDPQTGAQALVAINRSAEHPVRIRLSGVGTPEAGQVRHALISAPSSSAGGSAPAAQRAAAFDSGDIPLVREGDSLWFELPAASVASWRWE